MNIEHLLSFLQLSCPVISSFKKSKRTQSAPNPSYFFKTFYLQNYLTLSICIFPCIYKFVCSIFFKKKNACSAHISETKLAMREFVEMQWSDFELRNKERRLCEVWLKDSSLVRQEPDKRTLVRGGGGAHT